MIFQTTTALDLIKLALKTSGVLAIGQTAAAEDVNDALTLLNSMIATWNQNRWLVFHLLDIATPSTGALSYTVGPGGDFDVVRPDNIQSAYARLLQGSSSTSNSGLLDYQLGMIGSYEEYAAISIKQLKSFPSTVFYEASYPLGTLYVWPIPSAQFELHIVVKSTLPKFANLTDPISLPPEYFEALFYNLTGRLSLLYQMPVNPGVLALANAGLNTVRIANHHIPLLRMPSGLGRGRRGWLNHGIGGIREGTFTLDQDVLGVV